jgi:phenylpropionate dioxygenase-like ring-hydroxylating dioxygenase large terminal subunit
VAIAEPVTRAWELLDDASVIERILSHVEAGTTDLADQTWREPVENYRSASRLQAEMELVLRRYPTPFCPSAALAEPGAYVARQAAGVPIVAVRGRDGVARAFRNACRHRGTQIASGSGCAQSLVCPYHGWVYRLDGALRRVPDEHGFPDLDKDSRGLVAVATEERAGLVFVTQDEPVAPGASLDRLPELVGADQALVASSALIVDANWKVFVEGFLEGYHIKATHPETFYPFGYDNLNVIETFGRNSRVTFPFRRIEKLRDIAPADRCADGVLTYVYHLFPTAAVIRLTYHTIVVIVDPIAIDKTNSVTYLLTNRGSGPEARADAERDSDFVTRGAAEDREMALRVQRGLASGANQTLEFGRFEGAIGHFHRQLEELVGPACR